MENRNNQKLLWLCSFYQLDSPRKVLTMHLKRSPSHLENQYSSLPSELQENQVFRESKYQFDIGIQFYVRRIEVTRKKSSYLFIDSRHNFILYFRFPSNQILARYEPIKSNDMLLVMTKIMLGQGSLESFEVPFWRKIHNFFVSMQI